MRVPHRYFRREASLSRPRCGKPANINRVSLQVDLTDQRWETTSGAFDNYNKTIPFPTAAGHGNQFRPPDGDHADASSLCTVSGDFKDVEYLPQINGKT